MRGNMIRLTVAYVGAFLLFPGPAQAQGKVTAAGPVQVKELRRGYRIILSKKVAEELRDVLNDKVDEETIAKLLEGAVAVAIEANPEPTPPGQAVLSAASAILIHLAKTNLAKFKTELRNNIGPRGVSVIVDGSSWLHKYTPEWMDYLDTHRLTTEALRWAIRNAPISDGARSMGDKAVMVVTKTPVLALISSGYWKVVAEK